MNDYHSQMLLSFHDARTATRDENQTLSSWLVLPYEDALFLCFCQNRNRSGSRPSEVRVARKWDGSELGNMTDCLPLTPTLTPDFRSPTCRLCASRLPIQSWLLSRVVRAATLTRLFSTQLGRYLWLMQPCAFNYCSHNIHSRLILLEYEVLELLRIRS